MAGVYFSIFTRDYSVITVIYTAYREGPDLTDMLVYVLLYRDVRNLDLFLFKDSKEYDKEDAQKWYEEPGRDSQ